MFYHMTFYLLATEMCDKMTWPEAFAVVGVSLGFFGLMGLFLWVVLKD